MCVGFVMCLCVCGGEGVCNVCFCVCVGFVMCGCVCVLVLYCESVLKIVWVFW